MTFFKTNKRASSIALAIALATGGAVVASAVMPAEAHAQRKKRGNSPYSKEFVEAYTPVEEALKQEGVDIAALMPQIEALIAVSINEDEKMATGGQVLNAGLAASDQALQLRGLEMMMASGKVEPERIGQFNFNGYVLSNNTQQYAKARDYLRKTIDLGYESPNANRQMMQITLAELYWVDGLYKEGIASIEQAMDERRSAGQSVDANWYGRAITVAYENEVYPELWNMLAARNAEYPTTGNWRDWINRVRNLVDPEGQELLDLFRLSRATGAIEGKQEYLYYIELIDPRRFPQEAKEVIEESYATSVVSRDDIYVSDSLATANDRIASDRADLPSLISDARAPGAGLRTVNAAADAVFSYGRYADAAELYAKALALPGADVAEETTRLGMAQALAGDYDAAQETLAKVEGSRQALAMLWSAYAAEKSGGSNAGVEAAAEPIADAMEPVSE